jgi:hypothetical protein
MSALIMPRSRDGAVFLQRDRPLEQDAFHCRPARGFAPALTYTEEDVDVLITKLRRAIQLACSEIF